MPPYLSTFGLRITRIIIKSSDLRIYIYISTYIDDVFSQIIIVINCKSKCRYIIVLRWVEKCAHGREKKRIED